MLTARLRIGRFELSAVLHLNDVPAGSDELSAPLVDAYAGHNPVERLAVEVDKPHNVAEAGRRRVGDRFPDVAFVQLGVAEDGDEPRRGSGAEVGVDVPARDGGE